MNVAMFVAMAAAWSSGDQDLPLPGTSSTQADFRMKTVVYRPAISRLRATCPRRHPQKTFEPVRQMALVGVANGGRDVPDGDTAKQQLACALDSYVLQVRVRRQPDLFLKGPGEIERAEVDECSQFRKRDVGIIMAVDVLACCANCRSLV